MKILKPTIKPNLDMKLLKFYKDDWQVLVSNFYFLIENIKRINVSSFRSDFFPKFGSPIRS